MSTYSLEYSLTLTVILYVLSPTVAVTTEVPSLNFTSILEGVFVGSGLVYPHPPYQYHVVFLGVMVPKELTETELPDVTLYLPLVPSGIW